MALVSAPVFVRGVHFIGSDLAHILSYRREKGKCMFLLKIQHCELDNGQTEQLDLSKGHRANKLFCKLIFKIVDGNRLIGERFPCGAGAWRCDDSKKAMARIK